MVDQNHDLDDHHFDDHPLADHHQALSVIDALGLFGLGLLLDVVSDILLETDTLLQLDLRLLETSRVLFVKVNAASQGILFQSA